MPDYKDLSEKAKQLPGNLVVAHDKHYTYVSLFFTSVFCTQAYIDAQLIQKSARCLDYYPGEGNEKKSALLGMYIYVARQNYNGKLTFFSDKTLLNLLHKNLNIQSFTEFDPDLIKQCYNALDKFSSWVYEHKHFSEANDLFKVFPPDMKVVIQSFISTEKQSNGCLSAVSDWLSGLRV